MDTGGINWEFVGLLVTYVLRIFTKNKNEKLDRAAYVLQGIVLTAISKTRALAGKDADGATLKSTATDLISAYVQDKKIIKAIKKLGIPMDKEAIGEYIEVGLHAGKQGFNNALKDRFRGV